MNLTPGVSANFGKSGVSLSVGPRGCKTTFGKKGVRTTVGIPGTGLSATSYNPYKSKTTRSSSSYESSTVAVPIRSRLSNTIWGFVFLFLAIATVVFSFSYPHLINFGRWIMAILCGGFFLIGAIVFFTAKSKEDFKEEIDDLGEKLDKLEEKLADVKTSLSSSSERKDQITTAEIDDMLQCFYEKVQEYYKINISCLKNNNDGELKDKAQSTWQEVQNQITELDSIAQFMNPWQIEYYNTIKPGEIQNLIK